jgi:riboflavin synthase alpha subunit
VFTGIVRHVGRVLSVTPCESGRTLLVEAGGWDRRPAAGESVAVNGCCLTVAGAAAGRDAGALRFDVIRQTLAVTALGDLAPGHPVNLEPAVTPQTLLSGHLVQGHVDGVGTVRQVRADAAERRLRIEPPEDLMECIIERGSIAADGVSLTVAALGEDWLEVALIPTTIECTTLGGLREGSRVNLETDCIVKAVVGWLKGEERRSGSAARRRRE